jgi:hypothetical protein
MFAAVTAAQARDPRNLGDPASFLGSESDPSLMASNGRRPAAALRQLLPEKLNNFAVTMLTASGSAVKHHYGEADCNWEI